MIKERIKQAIKIKQEVLKDDKLIESIEKACDLLIECYQNNHKALFCGNGGSAADAQHLAAELSGKFYLDRPPIQAEACHVNSSFITAYSNDYHFAQAYERYVHSTGKEGDVFVAISTSGNSVNVLNAARKAKELKMKVIAMTGKNGGVLKEHCDVLINMPSTDTPRIQETQILIGHIICEIVEQKLFGS